MFVDKRKGLREIGIEFNQFYTLFDAIQLPAGIGEPAIGSLHFSLGVSKIKTTSAQASFKPLVKF
jgi:hypothetical protein